MTEAHKQRLCNNCREWIDARADQCYLCGTEKPEASAAAINASHLRELNANLGQHAARARAEQRIQPGQQGRTGPSRLYNVPGARDLAAHYKRQLQEHGFGES